MNDGSLRTTFASGTGNYPDCLSEEIEIMSNSFDQVDQIVSDIIEVVVGNELKYQDEKTVYDLKDSPLKEHVHIYTKSNDFDGIGKIISLHLLIVFNHLKVKNIKLIFVLCTNIVLPNWSLDQSAANVRFFASDFKCPF